MLNEKMTADDQVRDAIVGFWLGRSLAAAIEMKLPDLLNDRPLSSQELAAATGSDPDKIYRFMRALESSGFFRQVAPGVFTNSAATDRLRRDADDSLWSQVSSEVSWSCGSARAWNEVDVALKPNVIAFDVQNRMPFWDFMLANPAAHSVFNDEQRSSMANVTPTMTAAHDWGQYPVIADIGGGIGSQLVSILDAYPQSRGILFDQPAAIAEAFAHPRMQAVSGSFFESVPEGADAYILRMVIHNWPDDEAVEILKTVRKAMRPDSTLFLIETVVNDDPAHPSDSKWKAFGKWLDLLMLVLTDARERSTRAHRTLLDKAGFVFDREIETGSLSSILIARPS